MRKGFFSCGLPAILIVLLSCRNSVEPKKEIVRPYNHLEIDTAFNCNCSIRAIDVDRESIFFSGSNGVYGYLDPEDLSVKYIDSIEIDQKRIEFRGLSRTKMGDFILGVDNPAFICKVDPSGGKEVLFKQDLKGSFFDAMAFWNNREGVIIGDPTKGCMAFLITRDGGETWNPVPCDKIEKAEEGEAAFAASNSNIAIVGDSIWGLSGGQASRVYFSSDKGKNWKVFDTPLIDGKNTTGGYSIDFYDPKIGVVFGGDFTNPSRNTANKAVTTDGGKTWQLIADGEDPGYKSSIRFVPGRGGKEMIATGFTGISYTHDFGQTWRDLSEEEFYTLRFLNDSVAFAAGEGRIAKLRFKTEK